MCQTLLSMTVSWMLDKLFMSVGLVKKGALITSNENTLVPFVIQLQITISQNKSFEKPLF